MSVVAKLARDPDALLTVAWRTARSAPADAIERFAEAHDAATGSAAAAIACEAAAAAICLIDACYRDFRSFDDWCAKLDRVAPACSDESPAATRLLVLAARALAAMHGTSGERASQLDAGVAVSLLRQSEQPDIAVCAAAALVTAFDTARRDDAVASIEVEAAPLLRDAAQWPRGHWMLALGEHALFYHRLGEAAERLDKAAAIGDAAEIRPLKQVATLMQARLALAHGDLDGVERCLARTEPIDDEIEPMWRAIVLQLRTLACLRRERFEEGLALARRAIAHGEFASAPSDESIQLRVLEGYGLAAIGDDDGACAALRRAAARAAPAQADQIESLCDLLGASRPSGSERERRARYATALRRVRGLDFGSFFWPVPHVASRVCAGALELGVDVDYVRSLVRAHALPSPARAPATWPFACTVRALGGFSVRVGDRVLADTGRAQAKPLELLRAAVALRIKGGAEIDAVIRHVWPGQGRVGARAAFDVTLLRLRRLLGDPSAVVVAEGRLRLDPSRVWLDLAMLDEALDAVATAGDEMLPREVAALVDLYAGPLLSGDDRGWVAAARRALQLRVDPILADAIARLPPRSRLALLSRAVKADPALERTAAALADVR